MPEYEVEHASSYIGTYVDDIISGSMLDGIRGRVGSEYLPVATWLDIDMYSEYIWRLNYPFYHAGSTKQVGLFTANEYYYDSMVPNFNQITTINGARYVASQASEDLAFLSGYAYETPIFELIISKDPVLFVTGSDTNIVSDSYWFFDSPFEYKYSTVQRTPDLAVISVENSYVQRDSDRQWIAAAGTDITSSVARIVPSFISGVQGSLLSADTLYDFRTDPSMWPFLATTACNKKDFVKCYYGFGYRFLWYFVGLSSAANYESMWQQGVTIDGWKYGLYSGFATPTKAVFRTGHFGQPRDMLEGRPLTTFVDPTTMKRTEAPVQVRFVAGTDAAVTASTPSLNPNNSGIYDVEAKSAKPWADV